MLRQFFRGFWPILCAIAVVAALVLAGLFAPRGIPAQGKAALDITNRVAVPILVYHHISTDQTLPGKFYVTPSELETDLLYLRESGYTPIHLAQLVSYCSSGAPLPARPVVLTFDGSFGSGYRYAFPLLKKHGVKAVFSVTAQRVNESNAVTPQTAAPYLRWPELREMTESPLVELANQSNDMNLYTQDRRRGTARRRDEPLDAYVAALYDDAMLAQQQFEDKTGVLPLAYAYPYGIIAKDSVEPIRSMGFAVSLGLDEGLNYLSRNPDDLFGLKRAVRSHGESAEELLARIYRSKAVWLAQPSSWIAAPPSGPPE